MAAPLLMCFPSPPHEEYEDMAGITERVGVLEERVVNHIRFFWVVVAFGFLWLAALTGLLLQTKSAVRDLAQNQSNAPAQVAAAILSNVKTREEAVKGMTAVSSIIKSAQAEKHKASAASLQPVAEKLSLISDEFPDVPQVWQATSDFINYKSDALIVNADGIYARAAGKQCGMIVRLPGTVDFHDCEASLEDIASHISGMRSNGQLSPFVFTNCVVHYHGGILPDSPLIFRNSVFVFDVPTIPPPSGEHLMQEIAQAPSFNNVRIPANT